MAKRKSNKQSAPARPYDGAIKLTWDSCAWRPQERSPSRGGVALADVKGILRAIAEYSESDDPELAPIRFAARAALLAIVRLETQKHEALLRVIALQECVSVDGRERKQQALKLLRPLLRIEVSRLGLKP